MFEEMDIIFQTLNWTTLYHKGEYVFSVLQVYCLIYEMCLDFDATRTCLPMVFLVYVCYSAAPNSKLLKIFGMVCPYNHIQLGMVFD